MNELDQYCKVATSSESIRHHTPDCHERNNRLVVPEILRDQMIAGNHEKLFAEHFSVKN